MTIKSIRIKTDGEYIKIIAVCNLRYFIEDEIYFKIPKKYKDFLYFDASPFAAALLLASMRKGEDLIINGTISKKLYKNLYKVMGLYADAGIGLKRIHIKVQGFTEEIHDPQYVASFFSGGVDSFYTYLKHKDDSVDRLTHLILINGYDIDLNNKKLWYMTKDSIERIAKKGGVDVIEVESNIEMKLRPIIEWESIFGGCLGAVALLLRNKLKKVYIASSFSYEQQFAGAGSGLATDKYWGTDKLEIIHDGAETSRVKKVVSIASFPLVLENIRVCYRNLEEYNCGKCDKCLRTMIGLQLANKLSQAGTFPKEIDLNDIKKLRIETAHTAVFHKENLCELQKLGVEPELQAAIEVLLENFSEKQSKIDKLKAKVVYLDYIYTLGTFYKAFCITMKRFFLLNTDQKSSLLRN